MVLWADLPFAPGCVSRRPFGASAHRRVSSWGDPRVGLLGFLELRTSVVGPGFPVFLYTRAIEHRSHPRRVDGHVQRAGRHRGGQLHANCRSRVFQFDREHRRQRRQHCAGRRGRRAAALHSVRGRHDATRIVHHHRAWLRWDLRFGHHQLQQHAGHRSSQHAQSHLRDADCNAERFEFHVSRFRPRSRGLRIQRHDEDKRPVSPGFERRASLANATYRCGNLHRDSLRSRWRRQQLLESASPTPRATTARSPLRYRSVHSRSSPPRRASWSSHAPVQQRRTTVKVCRPSRSRKTARTPTVL